MSAKFKAKTDQANAVTTIRIPRTQLHKLRHIAEAEYRSVSQELRLLIDQRIAAHEAKHGAIKDPTREGAKRKAA